MKTWAPAAVELPSFVDGLQRLPGHPAAFFGADAAGRLPGVLQSMQAARVLVVHGQTSFRASGADRVVAQLANAHRVRSFDQVRPNPDLTLVSVGVAAVRDFEPDVIVGIGGGSALDMAKACAFLGGQSGTPRGCLLDPHRASAPRRYGLVLLPTTSGSGSEVTRFATVYHEARKFSIDHDDVRSDVALIDPELTRTLPVPHATASALDALAHAVESYWAVAATDDSRAVAATAMVALARAMSDGLREGGFAATPIRTGLAWGSALAGIAIDQTRTTGAHALSYALTTHLGIPHGVAVALHLQWLVGHNAEVVDDDCRHPAGATRLRALVSDIERIIERETGMDVPALTRAVLAHGGHPRGVSDLALSPCEWLPRFADALSSARAANNPRRVTESDVARALTGKE